jgi:hypothetical protein
MRRAALARVLYGTALLLTPDSVVERVAGGDTGGAFSGLRRVLGVRHVAQGLALRDADSLPAAVPGALADVAHVATLLPFLAADDGRRRAYALDAAAALTLLVADLYDAVSGGEAAGDDTGTDASGG